MDFLGFSFAFDFAFVIPFGFPVDLTSVTLVTLVFFLTAAAVLAAGFGAAVRKVDVWGWDWFCECCL